MSAQTRGAPVAAPKYHVGQIVVYEDRHGRTQSGEVRSIEANWHGWAKSDHPPLIIYRLAHPTYHNGQFYCTDAAISRATGEQA